MNAFPQPIKNIKDTKDLKLFTATTDELLSLKNASSELFSLRKKMKSWKPMLPNSGRRWLDWLCYISNYSFIHYSLVEILIILIIAGCIKLLTKNWENCKFSFKKNCEFFNFLSISFCFKGFISNSFLICF